MSWGLKITVLYLSFVAMIVTMVFLCMGQNVDLESKDYYAKELVFQDKINAIENSNALSQSIDYEIGKESILLKLPEELRSKAISGEVFFYRPSDAKMDVKLPLQWNTNGEQIISKKLLRAGMYKMQLSWHMNEKDYYKEIIINIQP